jgi:large subunit ribosomal protein L21
MTYAIIEVAGKQYRVREGEKLLVDRLAHADGASFSPAVLLVGGNGEPSFEPGSAVTAKVLGAVKGPKVRIGKYKKRTGYRRHTGFRASLTQIEIESIGGKATRSTAKPKAGKPAKVETQAPVDEPEASGMPEGYADLTIAQLKEQVGAWSRDEVEAALRYEHEHGKRKGALAALESALDGEGGES